MKGGEFSMLSASIHATRKKVVGALCVILAVVIAAILFFFSPEKTEGSVRLLTEEDRQAYMASFGWETEPEPSEIKTIVVPPEKDALMQRYNQIQLEQGMDFTVFCGQEATRYTYAVTNSEDGGTRICLYICDGVLAAADIASLEAGWQYGIAGRAESVAPGLMESGASESEESEPAESEESEIEESMEPESSEPAESGEPESGEYDEYGESGESEISGTMESGSSGSWWSRLFG
jgi:hypothetical protein